MSSNFRPIEFGDDFTLTKTERIGVNRYRVEYKLPGDETIYYAFHTQLPATVVELHAPRRDHGEIAPLAIRQIKPLAGKR